MDGLCGDIFMGLVAEARGGSNLSHHRPLDPLLISTLDLFPPKG